MKNIKAFSFTALGESHKSIHKICQDYSAHIEDQEKGLYACIVSDGHGGDIYFRSDRGSKFATQITVDAIRHFAEKTDKTLFNVPYVGIPARSTELGTGLLHKETDQDYALRHLFSYIISQWNDCIEKDWNENPPRENEMGHLPKAVREKYEAGIDKEKAYGCTLIAFVRTPDYWFAFQLGDGKCIGFESSGNWYEPVPWDEQCFLNATTSLCDKQALDNFRYCYGESRIPVALFIGSDGMDDSFGTVENLAGFYSTLLKMFIKEKYEKSLKEIEVYLPVLSAKGSRDDMSLAGVIDFSELKSLIPLLIENEKKQVQLMLEAAKRKIVQAEENLRQKKLDLEQSLNEEDVLKSRLLQQNDEISLAQKEEEKAKKKISKTRKALNEAILFLDETKEFVSRASDSKLLTMEELNTKEKQTQKVKIEVQYAELDVDRANKAQTDALQMLEKLAKEYEELSNNINQ